MFQQHPSSTSYSDRVRHPHFGNYSNSDDIQAQQYTQAPYTSSQSESEALHHGPSPSSRNPPPTTAATPPMANAAQPSPPYIAEPDERDEAPPTLEQVDSSAVSILSCSGTLVSKGSQRHSSSTCPPAYTHPLSRSSTAQTITPAQTPQQQRQRSLQQLSLCNFDPNEFTSVLHELNRQLDQFELLNDKGLEAMTCNDESLLGLTFLTHAPLSISSAESFSVEKQQPQHLEEERRRTAQAITDLVLVSWPRLVQSKSDPAAANATASATTSADLTKHSSASMQSSQSTQSMQMQMQARVQSQSGSTKKTIKQRTKVATQLKQAIVSFWSAQSTFEEKAQLILDIYQDPTELEHDDRIRILRSRHLENLLSSCSLSPAEGDPMAQKFETDQEKMALITEQLRGVWLSLLMVLENPGHQTKSRAMEEVEGDTNNCGIDHGGGDAHESLGQKLLRMSKVKRQALKNMIGSW